MNPQITTLDPVGHPLKAKTILAREGFTCRLLTLAPGDQTPRREGREVEEHLLFLIEGAATIEFGEVNVILGKDEALLIPSGKEHVITAHRDDGAKVLQVDVPPRQVITPQILSFDR